MVTAIRMAPAATPSAPEDLHARVHPDFRRRPVQAVVELTWRAEAMTNFAADARARVFYTLSRSASGGDALLHHKDDESGQLLPHVPTQRQPFDGRLRLVDN